MHLPHDPSGQPGTSNESCGQASTSSSDTDASSTICCWLTCCSPHPTLAVRFHGPDGNHCSWCGCGLFCPPHARSCMPSVGASVEEATLTPQGLTSLTRSRRQLCLYASRSSNLAHATEMKQFLEGARNQSDLKLCEGFSEVPKQCGYANGLA